VHLDWIVLERKAIMMPLKRHAWKRMPGVELGKHIGLRRWRHRVSGQIEQRLNIRSPLLRSLYFSLRRKLIQSFFFVKKNALRRVIVR
jgi:hypothetical protein